MTSDSVSLVCQCQGEQSTLCLYLHGGPGSGVTGWKSFFWGLPEKHFQMVYLTRGEAIFQSGDGNFSMDRMVRDFEEIRQALGISQWLTLGFVRRHFAKWVIGKVSAENQRHDHDQLYRKHGRQFWKKAGLKSRRILLVRNILPVQTFTPIR